MCDELNAEYIQTHKQYLVNHFFFMSKNKKNDIIK
jgi:hypothetical protein